MTAAAPLGVVTFCSPILRGRPALVHRGSADGGPVGACTGRQRLGYTRSHAVAAARAVGPNAWCDSALLRSCRAIPHDGHIAGLRGPRGMGRGDEMILCRALTPSTVPLDALETVWLTTTQGGPLCASSSD